MEKREIDKTELTHQQVLENISQSELGGKIIHTEELTGGFYGHVYKVTVETKNGQKDFVVKFVENKQEPSFEQEEIDNRVYGARWSNLKPSYDLLKQHNLPVAELKSIKSEGKYNYSVTEFLEGDSLKDLMLKDDTQELAKLHSMVGDQLGKMHAITRDYFGWVDMQKPYDKNWKDSFFESCQSHLQNACANHDFIKQREQQIQTFLEQRKNDWTDPKQFVFSHTDGVQGIAMMENNQWQLNGFIDVEDNMFTDQRFVLAGHEMVLEWSNKVILPEFWEQYQNHIAVDETFQKTKSLFKLYYLISWTWAFGEGWRGSEQDKQKAMSKLELLLKTQLEL
mgnify:CR=1 FL=1